MLLVSKVLQSTEKSYTRPFNLVIFILLAEKSHEIFPKHKEYFFYVKIFCFEFIYFCSIKQIKNILLPL